MEQGPVSDVPLTLRPHHLYAEECVIKIAKPGRLRRSPGLTHPDAPLLHLVENVLLRMGGEGMMAVMTGYQLPGVPPTHLTSRVQVPLLQKFKDKDSCRLLLRKAEHLLLPFL